MVMYKDVYSKRGRRRSRDWERVGIARGETEWKDIIRVDRKAGIHDGERGLSR